MSTPTPDKPKTTDERLTKLETDLATVQKDADQTAKALEHAEVALKPELIGAAVAGSIAAGGVTLLAPAFTVFKAELPTVKDFTPQIDAFLDRRFGWTSEALKTERALERRFSGIEAALELNNTKIVDLRNRMAVVQPMAEAADRRSRATSTDLNRRHSEVQRVGHRNPLDVRQVQDAQGVATEVRRLEFHINRLITALSS